LPKHLKKFSYLALKIILLDYRNNYMKYLNTVLTMPQHVLTFLAISLNVLYNYFDDQTKLFSDLYLAKFLNILTKPFFYTYKNYL